MIKITRLNGRMTVVNAALITTVEATPDTMITLTNGQKLAVLESVDEVIELVYEYRRQVHLPPRGAAQPVVEPPLAEPAVRRGG